jgi:hypothetical protein
LPFAVNTSPIDQTIKDRRIKKCRDLLPLPQSIEDYKSSNVVPGDESSFIVESQRSAKWSTSRQDVPQLVRQQIGAKKSMLPVIWGVDGVHVIDSMTGERNAASILSTFMDNMIVTLVEKVVLKGRNRDARQIRIHLGNCRVHFSNALNNLSPTMTFHVFRRHLTEMQATDFVHMPMSALPIAMGMGVPIADRPLFRGW